MPKLIVDGSKIYYHEVGAGEKIILLHCSSSSHRQWKNLWNALKKKYHVIAIDLLGWGETDAWRKDRDDLLASEASIVSKIIGSFHWDDSFRNNKTLCSFFRCYAKKQAIFAYRS